jgi:hypothetical protein
MWTVVWASICDTLLFSIQQEGHEDGQSFLSCPMYRGPSLAVMRAVVPVSILQACGTSDCFVCRASQIGNVFMRFHHFDISQSCAG